VPFFFADALLLEISLVVRRTVYFFQLEAAFPFLNWVFQVLPGFSFPLGSYV